MNNLSLTPAERQNVESGRWFSKLSEPLRRDILARAVVRRHPDGTTFSMRGSRAEEWMCVARGAVRIGAVSLSGRPVSLTYVKPGMWFADISLFDGLPRTHDAEAHGETTLLYVRRPDFMDLLARHVELYDALLRLNCRRLRVLFDHIEDLSTRPLSARLVKQLLLLVKGYGVAQGAEMRIGLRLAQEELAHLLSASRQRVNQELKALERQGVVRLDPNGIVVLSGDRLAATFGVA